MELLLTILVLVAGFYMAWNIGANDVSNAMGTSVGSGALTLFRAVVIASVLEFAGAFLLGGNVSETMQSGIVDPGFFAGDPQILFFGMLAALIATALWLQVASYFGWPVSTTHAIVGSLLGFGLVAGGASAIKWETIGEISLGWVLSPAISGIFAFIIFRMLQKKIFFTSNPLQATRRLLPYLVGIVFMVFTLSALLGGFRSSTIDFTLSQTALIALAIGTVATVVTRLLTRNITSSHPLPAGPYLPQQVHSLGKAARHLKRVRLITKGEKRKAVTALLRDVEALSEQANEEAGQHVSHSDFTIVEKLFTYLQILSAAYVAFAHGANDVANAIGPVAAALELARTGALSAASTIPSWLLALGGAGIVIGLATWGWRVIETIGKKITELTPTRGFCAEFGAATTILVASKMGLPVSTTHCIVGAVLGVGLARGLTALNLRTLREIVLSWIVTIPSSALVAILVFSLLKAIFS